MTIGTWNVAGKSSDAKLDIEEWLCMNEPADIYVLGSQEVLTELAFPVLEHQYQHMYSNTQVQEVVISADVRCKECQKRITAVISRLNAETESVVVNVMEKKVTFICKYPKIIPPDQKQIIAAFKNPLPKIALFRIICRPLE